MRFLFVGGSQRSGTSMLQRLLCSHPSANSKIKEASYLRSLLAAYKFGRDDFDNDTRDYFGDMDFYRRFNRTIVESVLVNVADLQNPQRDIPVDTVVCKEPHLTMFFPELGELLDNAVFILIARDPRDVIASMVVVGEKLKQSGQAHFFQNRDMVQLSNHVKSFYAPSINITDPTFQQRLLKVKYEDIVQDVGSFMQLMKTSLDLDLSNSIAESGVSGQKYEPWQTEQNFRDVNIESIGRYKNILSSDEIAIVERECEDYMKVFGYK